MKRIVISTVFLSSLIIGCGNEPLFDNLAENNIHIVVKGTYESNTPRPWLSGTVINDDNMTVLPPSGTVGAPASYNSWPTQFMIDIAELQIDGERFANYRGVYTCPMTNTEPFFSGEGIAFDNDDVRTGRTYSTIQMYLRKTMYDNAHLFYPVSGGFYKTATSIFHETKTNGYDFILDQVDNFYDALRKNYGEINRVYPLAIPISGGFVFDNSNEYVLEVRVVVKNFLKRYEVIKTIDDTIYSCHYFGFSDWLYDSRGGDGRIGGNMIGVARWYIKGQTRTVTGSAPPGYYVIGIPAEDNIADYSISAAERTRPSDAWAPRNSPKAGDDIISLLDYYVDLQKRAEDYSLLYTAVHPLGVADSAPYLSEWDTNYNNKISSYKIPPLVVFNSGGTYRIDNVQTGKSYKFYYANENPAMDELPSSFTQVSAAAGAGVYIPPDSTGSDFLIP